MAVRENSGREPTNPFSTWVDTLLSRPLDALTDLLDGRGARGAPQLAEPSDFLADLLAQESVQDRRQALLEAIDGALLEWMESRAGWPPARIDEFGTRAYVAQFSDALAVAGRLPLSLVPGDLLRRARTWDGRFRAMRWPNDIDLLRRFDLTLARHQRDRRLASRWFEACDEAAWGGPYWRSALNAGLMGLRKMRDPSNAQPERRVATALARFAALSCERRTDAPELRTAFQREAAALTALYPRHDTHWREVWSDALATVRGNQRRLRVRDAWLRLALPAPILPELDETGDVISGQAPAVGRPRAQLPSRGRLAGVTRSINRALSPVPPALWSRARSLINDHWAYARDSGDAYYAVRTTHNLCDRLLRKGPRKARSRRFTSGRFRL